MSKTKLTKEALSYGPLPQEIHKHYDEFYVKAILESVYSSEYTDLQIGESPDLRNPELSIGVEVTNGTCPSELENGNLFARYPTSNNQQAIMNRLNQNGCDMPLEGLLIRRYAIAADETRLQWADELIVAKIQKLNSHYTLFQRNDLAIIIEEPVDMRTILQHQDTIFRLNAGPVKFDNIYIIDIQTIYRYNTRTYTCERVDITQQQGSYSAIARQMAIDEYLNH